MKYFIMILFMLFLVTDVFGLGDINNKRLEKYNILGEDILVSDSVSRAECIVTIMKLIGVTENHAERYGRANLDEPIFNDERDMYKEEKGYIRIAGTSRIALRIRERDFFPKRNVTVKECTAFIMRCLESSSPDLEETFLRAVEIGLVFSTDSFYEKSDDDLLPHDFYIILDRMLDQKRYIYYYEGFHELQTHEAKSVTYLEYLENRIMLQKQIRNQIRRNCECIWEPGKDANKW